MDGAAEAVADAVGDALLITVDADQWREKSEEKNDECGDGEIEETSQGATAESRVLVHCRGIDGSLDMLVGWIHFLHGCPGRQFSVVRSQCEPSLSLRTEN